MSKLQTILRTNQKNGIHQLFKSILSQDRLARLIFIAYLPQELIVLSTVSKHMHQIVFKALLNQREILANKLLVAYGPYLKLLQQKEYLSLKQRFRFFQNKYCPSQIQKINFVFAFKCRQKISQNTIYQLCYSYQLQEKKKSQKKKLKQSKKYFWKIQFECLQKESTEKQFWLYRNPKKQQMNLEQLEVFTMEQDSKDQTYIMDCKEISQNDLIKIEFPYFVNKKIANVQQFTFYPLKAKIEELSFTSTIQKFFNKKKPTNCDVQNRYEWRKYQYFKNALDFELQDIISCYKELELQQIYVNTLEDHYKIELKCKQMLKKSQFLGHYLSISKKNQQVDVHIKHKGAISQENQEINLRIGDLIIVYVNIK